MSGQNIQSLLFFMVLMTAQHSYVFGRETAVQDLVQACEFEMTEKNAQGSCLRLGILALKAKHLRLFEKIQDSCIEQVKAGLIDQPQYFQPLLSYYPKCNYIYSHKLKNLDVNLELKEEFKTLVRFLN